MSRITNFPNGSSLTSSAIALSDLQTLLQNVTAQMLGINAASDPQAYYKVRIDYPTDGQPDWKITEDICFVRAIEKNEEYTRIHEIQYAENEDLDKVDQTANYTRCWEFHWTLYGPNSFDRAQTIREAMYLDFVHDAFAAVNLYVVPEPMSPARVPEEFQGQWWERTDFSATFNEGVTNSITIAAGASVEVSVSTPAGTQEDQVIVAAQ